MGPFGRVSDCNTELNSSNHLQVCAHLLILIWYLDFRLQTSTAKQRQALVEPVELTYAPAIEPPSAQPPCPCCWHCLRLPWRLPQHPASQYCSSYKVGTSSTLRIISSGQCKGLHIWRKTQCILRLRLPDSLYVHRLQWPYQARLPREELCTCMHRDQRQVPRRYLICA